MTSVLRSKVRYRSLWTSYSFDNNFSSSWTSASDRIFPSRHLKNSRRCVASSVLSIKCFFKLLYWADACSAVKVELSCSLKAQVLACDVCSLVVLLLFGLFMKTLETFNLLKTRFSCRTLIDGNGRLNLRFETQLGWSPFHCQSHWLQAVSSSSPRASQQLLFRVNWSHKGQLLLQGQRC